MEKLKETLEEQDERKSTNDAETSQSQADDFSQGDSEVGNLDCVSKAQGLKEEGNKEKLEQQNEGKSPTHPETSQSQIDNCIQGDSKVETLDCVSKALGLKGEGNKEKLEEQNEGNSTTDTKTSHSQADDFFQGESEIETLDYVSKAQGLKEEGSKEKLEEQNEGNSTTDPETSQSQVVDCIQSDSEVETLDCVSKVQELKEEGNKEKLEQQDDGKSTTNVETSQSQADDCIQDDSEVETSDCVSKAQGLKEEGNQEKIDQQVEGKSTADPETSHSQADDFIQGDSEVETLDCISKAQGLKEEGNKEKLEEQNEGKSTANAETSQSQVDYCIQGDFEVETLDCVSKVQGLKEEGNKEKLEQDEGKSTTNAETSHSQGDSIVEALDCVSKALGLKEEENKEKLEERNEGKSTADPETSQSQADDCIQGDSEVETLDCVSKAQGLKEEGTKEKIDQQDEGKSTTDPETSHSQADDFIQGDSKVENFDCVSKAQGLKEEGNKLFQKRDYEGAMLRYEEAIKILPQDHEEVSHIRANLASCYMQLDPGEYVKAIRECNLALNITPDHTKALLKRARCYEALKKFDLSLKDVSMVSKLDPNNPMASDISGKLERTLESKGLRVKDSVIELSPDYVEPAEVSPAFWAEEGRTRSKKKSKIAEMGQKIIDKQNKKKVAAKQSEKRSDTSKAQEKVIIEEKLLDISVGVVKKAVKFVYSDDIRLAELPYNCNLFQLREVVHERFPSLRAVHIKYKDQEGDLVTITTDEELRMCEVSSRSLDTMRYYVVEVRPEQDPFFGRLIEMKKLKITSDSFKRLVNGKGTCKIEDWMIEFAQLFKIQANIGSHACLNLQELGMKLNSEAMEEAVTSDAAQGPFDKAVKQFQELAARSLLKLGNVHMSGARKRLSLLRGVSVESVLEQVKTAYEHAQKDHAIAEEKYEEAMKIKPDWFEVFLALGLQQFEEARLRWYYALVSHIDLKAWPYAAVVQLYQSAEINIKKSMEGLKNMESKKDCETSQAENCQTAANSTQVNQADEAAKLKSWLDVLLCAVLYERSIMEYKLDLPIWRENLEAAMEKYELAETCREDIAAVINEDYVADNTFRDLRFLIEDTIKIINEIYGAERWRNGISPDQLEEILKKRTAKIFRCQIEESNMVEGVCMTD